jgi:hypothetical protein
MSLHESTRACWPEHTASRAEFAHKASRTSAPCIVLSLKPETQARVSCHAAHLDTGSWARNTLVMLQQNKCRALCAGCSVVAVLADTGRA